ncbi:hypothetical protein [Pontibacter sp. H249]|uniref:hypothetical protein n=1 Tax=Pontibacter sp. H249 TaxID=3133420 RepID=UPI0030BC8CE2
MAEKLTPSFIFKLILLFALLLTSVFLRSNKVVLPANAKNVQQYSPSATTDNVQEQDTYYRVVSQKKTGKTSI